MRSIWSHSSVLRIRLRVDAIFSFHALAARSHRAGAASSVCRRHSRCGNQLLMNCGSPWCVMERPVESAVCCGALVARNAPERRGTQVMTSSRLMLSALRLIPTHHSAVAWQLRVLAATWTFRALLAITIVTETDSLKPAHPRRFLKRDPNGSMTSLPSQCAEIKRSLFAMIYREWRLAAL